MTDQQTCPHCGAEMAYDDPHYTRFKCGSVVWRDGTTGRRDYACYITELEKKDAEIERLKQAVLDEREACSDIADQLGTFGYDGHKIAKAIRARNKNEPASGAGSNP